MNEQTWELDVWYDDGLRTWRAKAVLLNPIPPEHCGAGSITVRAEYHDKRPCLRLLAERLASVEWTSGKG